MNFDFLNPLKTTTKNTLKRMLNRLTLIQFYTCLQLFSLGSFTYIAPNYLTKINLL